MDKETFKRLIEKIPQIKEEESKILKEEEEKLKKILFKDWEHWAFSEDEKFAVFNIVDESHYVEGEGYKVPLNNAFIFDMQDFHILIDWYSDDYSIGKKLDEEQYLCLVHNKSKYKVLRAHRVIMKQEIENFAEERNYSLEDVHVHHKNEDKCDNRRRNLEVLHKDDHAKRHGFDTWEEYMRWIEEKNDE